MPLPFLLLGGTRIPYDLQEMKNQHERSDEFSHKSSSAGIIMPGMDIIKVLVICYFIS